MTDLRTERGRAGEDAAFERYRAFGYRLVARNWRCALGELDLVVGPLVAEHQAELMAQLAADA